MLRHATTILCVSSLLLCGAGVGSATTVINLSAMDSYYWSIPGGINASDAVVGQGFANAYHAFLYTCGLTGTMNDIYSKMGGGSSTATVINDNGLIAGGSYPPTNAYYCTGWPGGSTTTLLLPGNITGGNRAVDIDAAGNVIGYAKNNASPNTQVGFIYHGNTMYELPRPTSPIDPPYTGSYGYAVFGYGVGNATYTSATNGTQIVGYARYAAYGSPTPPIPVPHAIVWNYGFAGSTLTATPIDINSYLNASDGVGSQALSINASGMVFGQYGNGPDIMPNALAPSFVFDTNTNVKTDLASTGLHTYPSSGIGYCDLINNANQVVGFTGTKDDPGARAVIWDATNGVRDLNIVCAAALTAWSAAHGGVTLTLNAATAIGNDGSIAGIATDSLGHTKQGFLIIGAVPIPEPSTLLLAGMGLFGLLAYAWRKRK